MRTRQPIDRGRHVRNGPTGSPERAGTAANSTQDNRRVLNALFEDRYTQPRRLASRMRSGNNDSSLNTAALLNETYIKLRRCSTGLQSELYEEIVGILAHAMQQILVDAARRRNALKRVPVAPSDSSPMAVEDALALEAVIEKLQQTPRQANIVRCRFYLGMTTGKTAMALGLSKATVERGWQHAREYLDRRVRLGREQQ